MFYNYVIVGGGPSGLTLAHILSKNKKKVLILEKESSLGGCHRVDRVNGLFTEHGPRIYSSAYVNFNKLLHDMGTDLKNKFVEYNFNISKIGGYSLNNFNIQELSQLALAFLIYLIYPSYGLDTSMQDFTNFFSQKSKDYIDNLCRLTDGAGSDRYSLNEFLGILNHQAFQTIYQPKAPMDVEILPRWEEYLTKNGVDIVKKFTVNKINLDNNSNVLGIGNDIRMYSGNNFVLAMPPKQISELLSQNGLNNSNFEKFANDTNYVTYIPITFHWNKAITLPSVYGFPNSSWGLCFIVLSDYMKDIDGKGISTVISTAITKVDIPSTVSGKTANNSTSDELISEAFRQLKLSFPGLQDPDNSIISPTISRNGDKWVSNTTAYVASARTSKIPFKMGNNLYNLGTHNGYEKYPFTSLESAVSNAFKLGEILEKEYVYTIDSSITVRDVLICFIVFIVLVCIIYYKYYKVLSHN